MAGTDIGTGSYFWRRAFAIIIDYVFVTTVVGACGLLLFQVTGSTIRIDSLVVKITVCGTPNAAGKRALDATNWPLPAEFQPTSVQVCKKSFLGIPHDYQLQFQHTTSNGRGIFTKSINLAVDGNLKPVNAIYLDHFNLLLLFAYLWFAELRFGTSIGKLLLKLRVRSFDFDNSRLDAREVAIRLARFSAFIPIVVSFLFLPQTFMLSLGLTLFCSCSPSSTSSWQLAGENVLGTTAGPMPS